MKQEGRGLSSTPSAVQVPAGKLRKASAHRLAALHNYDSLALMKSHLAALQQERKSLNSSTMLAKLKHSGFCKGVPRGNGANSTSDQIYNYTEESDEQRGEPHDYNYFGRLDDEEMKVEDYNDSLSQQFHPQIESPNQKLRVPDYGHAPGARKPVTASSDYSSVPQRVTRLLTSQEDVKVPGFLGRGSVEKDQFYMTQLLNSRVPKPIEDPEAKRAANKKTNKP